MAVRFAAPILLAIALAAIPAVTLADSHDDSFSDADLIDAGVISPTPAPPGFLGGFASVEDGRAAAGVAEGSLLDLLFQALRVFLIFLAVIALAALIWGGVLYIISLGNDQDIQKAKKIIIYAIVGLVVVMLAGLVVNVVINIFGVGGGTP